ncbi:MAG: extracellular solute-binding protein [Lachnospiraceae bacterium]|nr:extracellular solute-binding protein [Lachnospiraceae bacterium]
MKKAIIKILILMGICGILNGCGSPKDDVVEITMIHGWGSTEYDHVVMRQIYEEFEKVHPEIHLNMVAMPSSTDVISKVGDLLTVGEIPDIVFTGGDGRESIYSFMVEEGYAVDLMPYIQEDQELEANVSPVIMENWTTENGNLYTVSDVLLMGGYWYNEEIFEKAGIDNVPETWEEWMEACRKIKKSDGKTVPIILDSNHISYLMTTILADEELTQLKEAKNSKIQINSASFDKMLSRLREISKYATLAGDYNYRDTLASFNAGESAIYINGVWANFMIDNNLQVAYAPFPSDDGNGIATKSACVGYILGNTGDEKRIDASVKFLKYMLSEDVAVKIMEKTGQMPSNPNVEITEESVGSRLYQAVTCVENAGLIIETPENLWDLSEKKEYGENVILYLQNRIGEEEFRERLSRL